jgi:hypothetical protein
MAYRAQLSALQVLRPNRPSNSGLAETTAALITARKMYEDRMMKTIERDFESLYLSINETLDAVDSDQTE